MFRCDPERGQATVEWIGLVLGVALLLGAAAAGGREAAKGESADALGDAVAERIVCAAKGACGAGTRGGRMGGRGGGRLGGALGARDGGRLRAPGGASGRRLGAVPRGAPGGRLGLLGGGASPRPSPGAPSGSHAGVLSGVARRAWFLCLGYRRWQYDREHPRPPLEGVPLRETVKVVNECVNPLSFLF